MIRASIPGRRAPSTLLSWALAGPLACFGGVADEPAGEASETETESDGAGEAGEAPTPISTVTGDATTGDAPDDAGSAGAADLPPTIEALLIDGEAAPARLDVPEARSAIIEVVAADDRGIEAVTLVIDGVELAALDAPPYRFTWEIDDVVAAAPRIIEAIARDDLGQETRSTAIKVSFDLPPGGSERWQVLTDDDDAIVDDLALAGDAVIAAGSRATSGESGGRQALIRRYARATGALELEIAYPPAASGGLYRARALALGADGQIAAAGAGSPGDPDDERLWLARFAADGTLLRQRLVAEVEGAAHGLALVGDDLVIVGDALTDGSPRALVARYDGDLEPRWSRLCGGEIAEWSIGRGLAVGGDGAIYIAGTIDAESAAPRLLAAAYSPDGALLWGGPAAAAGELGDTGVALAIGHDGDLAIGGSMLGPDGQRMTIRWFDAATGESRGLFPIPSVGEGGDEIVTAITADHHGRIYVTTTVEAAIGERDVVVFKRSLDGGAAIWERLYDGSAHGDDRGQAIAVDPLGYVYAAGALRHLGAPRWWIQAQNP